MCAHPFIMLYIIIVLCNHAFCCASFVLFKVEEKILEAKLNKREAKEFKAELLFAD